MATSGVWEVVLLPRSYSQIPYKQQAPVVQTLDSAIHRINHYPGDKCCVSVGETNCAIQWIVIYSLDSVIQFLKNWDLDISVVKLNLLTGLQIFSSLKRTTVLVRHHLGRTSPKKGLNFISIKTEAWHTKSMLFRDFEIILTQRKICSSQGRYLFFLTFKIIYDKKIFTQVGFCRTLANLVGQCPMTDCYLQPCFVIKPPDSTYCVYGSTQKSLIFTFRIQKQFSA